VKYKYPFIKPNFPSSNELVDDYTNIVNSNWFTNFGPYENKLSNEAADYVGNNLYATTVSNCTAGLEITIAELFTNKKGNGKVLMPSFTFVAGAEALIKNNLTPILIDVNEKNWQPNIDQARSILESSKESLSGILLCNIFGVGNEIIREWEILSSEYDIPMIVDSAAGFGSSYSASERIGARGDCEIFSLHATKPFSVGEGGLILSKDKDLIERLRSMQNFGFESDRNVHRIGTNAKMQELSCAIGVRQLAHLSQKIEDRQKVFSFYKQKLGVLGYEFQENTERSTVAFVSALVPDGISVENIKANLVEAGIEARRYYVPALHQQSILLEYCETPVELTVTEEICSRVISLPLYEDMTEDDVTYICNSIETNL
jgi:dTDP-4-amino-4,6-dideoxygalactose transaminase